jgi:hypothetical protein
MESEERSKSTREKVEEYQNLGKEEGYWEQRAHLGRHVMRDAELQVLQDALHGVVRLLLGGPKVLLHGTSHGVLLLLFL